MDLRLQVQDPADLEVALLDHTAIGVQAGYRPHAEREGAVRRLGLGRRAEQDDGRLLLTRVDRELRRVDLPPAGGEADDVQAEGLDQVAGVAQLHAELCLPARLRTQPRLIQRQHGLLHVAKPTAGPIRPSDSLIYRSACHLACRPMGHGIVPAWSPRPARPRRSRSAMFGGRMPGGRPVPSRRDARTGPG